MTKTARGITAIFIVLTIIVIIYFLSRKFFKNSGGENSADQKTDGGEMFDSGSKGMKDGYSKKSGQWVGADVVDYNQNYYEMTNSAGSTIYAKKDQVTTKTCKKGATETLCAYAATDLTVKYIS